MLSLLSSKLVSPKNKPNAVDELSTTDLQLVDRTEESNNIQESVLRTMVSSENDALNILFEAATCTEPANAFPSTSKTALTGFPSVREVEESPISLQQSTPQLSSIDSIDYDILRIWNACRFVKMGWFTAHEAMTLADL